MISIFSLPETDIPAFDPKYTLCTPLAFCADLVPIAIEFVKTRPDKPTSLPIATTSDEFLAYRSAFFPTATELDNKEVSPTTSLPIATISFKLNDPLADASPIK